MKTYTLKIQTTGVGFNKSFAYPLPQESDLVTAIEDGMVAANVKMDATVTVTKDGKGGFHWSASIQAPGGVNEAFNVTQPANGVPGMLEGIYVGQGKTYTAEATLGVSA